MAEWWRAVRARAAVSTLAVTPLPTVSLPVVTTPWWPNTLAWIFWVSSTGEDAVHRAQLAAVAHLAAGFGVERGVVEHHHAHLALGEFIDRHAVLVEGQDVALGLQGRRSRGRWWRRAVVFEVGGHLELAGGAGLFFWRAIAASKAAESTVTLPRSRQIVGGEVEREAEGVVSGRRIAGLAVENLLPAAAISASSPSRIAMPFSMVAKKRFLLDFEDPVTRCWPALSSG